MRKVKSDNTVFAQSLKVVFLLVLVDLLLMLGIFFGLIQELKIVNLIETSTFVIGGFGLVAGIVGFFKMKHWLLPALTVGFSILTGTSLIWLVFIAFALAGE